MMTRCMRVLFNYIIKYSRAEALMISMQFREHLYKPTSVMRTLPCLVPFFHGVVNLDKPGAPTRGLRVERRTGEMMDLFIR